MAKQQLHLSVTHDLVQQAKEVGINLSELMEEALKYKLGQISKVPINEIISDLKEQRDNADKIIIELEEKSKELAAAAKTKESWFKEIPELQGLTVKQLSDMKFLMGLIELIRSKYSVRIGIIDIKEHYGV